MSLLAILLIAVAALVAVFFIGGLIAARRRDLEQADTLLERIAAADQALEAARAADKGWDRDSLAEAARRALTERRPGFACRALHLVLVDDRPGTEDDRAHFVAVGDAEEVRLVLARRDAGWAAERVE